jgi:regulator of replication initiation timing
MFSETQIRRNDDVALTCKTIKNYTEKTLKEVAEFEEIENEEMYVMPPNIENGEIHIFPRHPLDNNQPMMHHQEMEVDPIDIESHDKEEKVNKINGSVTNENQNYILEKKGILRCDDNSLKPVLNGESPSNSVCNLRTLSYDEYMKGSINDEIHEEVIHDDGVEVMQDISEKSNNNDTDSACILRIENVSSCYSHEEKMPNMYDNDKVPTLLVNQSTETIYQEHFEINSLRVQLEKKNSQLDNLRDAFQKTMSENMSMKMELDNLKKMLAYYQEQQKPVPETKVIAVQTEHPIPISKTAIVEPKNNEQKTDSRLITNSMISTISSQWSDGTESATISMEPPPNITNAINSDESMQQAVKTPLKQKNTFSRAFITSSKILQTLSSITHGKSKSDRYGCKFYKTGNEPEVEPNSSLETEKTQFVEAGSRKRKATDSADFAGSAHPFKIPHTSKSNWETGKRRANSPEVEFVDVDNENNLNNTEEEQNESEKVEDIDDDVKVFVYPEDDETNEHSFLIQAREVSSNPKSGIRECGPYLLGNIEVYMTEMNGTINIWGKELSQNTANQNNEELEASARSKDLRPSFRWQSTPRIFNNQATASTNKKPRVLPRFTQQQKQHSCEINNTIVDCESCNSRNHRLSWPSCNQNLQYENQHTCCSPSVRVEEIHCGCGRKVERRNVGAPICCNSSKFVEARQCSMPNACHENNLGCCCNNRHSQHRNALQEEPCRHQSFVRRHSFNPTDEEENECNVSDNSHNTSKSCHSLQENSLHSFTDTKLVPPCLNNGKNNGASCSEASVCQNENDPLILQRQNQEAPEVTKMHIFIYE